MRLTVRAGDTRTIREGSGLAWGWRGNRPNAWGEAHEFAAKTAETNGALSTFGNAFGLSLYSGTAEILPPAKRQRPLTIPPPKKLTINRFPDRLGRGRIQRYRLQSDRTV
jgi:hypothetical protein